MKCKSEINAIMLKELNAKMKILYLIFLIIGSVGVGTYIVLAVIFDSVPGLDYLLICSSAYFAIGIVLLVTMKRSTKKQLAENKYDEYEFLEDCIVAKGYKNNEHIATVKYKYDGFVKIKETEHYLFLYPNKFFALGVPKDQFKKEEFEQIVEKVKVNNR